MTSRKIMRIELTAEAKRKVTEISDATGMTQVAIMSRLMHWLCRQPESLQHRVLGKREDAKADDTTKMILQEMAAR